MESVSAEASIYKNCRINIVVGWANCVIPYSAEESDQNYSAGVLGDIRFQRASMMKRFIFDHNFIIHRENSSIVDSRESYTSPLSFAIFKFQINPIRQKI